MKTTVNALTAALTLLFIADSAAENRTALIVGCDYKGTSLELPSPVKDAKALAAELTKVGFPSSNLTLLINPTRQQLVDACDKFHEQLKASGGVGLFYFSGHGAQLDGTNYLIPCKAAVKFREHLKTEGLAANYVATNMEAADPFATTAPVGSFAPDGNGLYDLSGNVWEWCEDWYSGTQKYRVQRGGSWLSGTDVRLRFSFRSNGVPDYRGSSRGFRCVLEVADR